MAEQRSTCCATASCSQVEGSVVTQSAQDPELLHLLAALNLVECITKRQRCERRSEAFGIDRRRDGASINRRGYDRCPAAHLETWPAGSDPKRVARPSNSVSRSSHPARTRRAAISCHEILSGSISNCWCAPRHSWQCQRGCRHTPTCQPRQGRRRRVGHMKTALGAAVLPCRRAAPSVRQGATCGSVGLSWIRCLRRAACGRIVNRRMQPSGQLRCAPDRLA